METIDIYIVKRTDGKEKNGVSTPYFKKTTYYGKSWVSDIADATIYSLANAHRRVTLLLNDEKIQASILKFVATFDSEIDQTERLKKNAEKKLISEKKRDRNRALEQMEYARRNLNIATKMLRDAETKIEF